MNSKKFKKLVLFSKNDLAGSNIAHILRNNYGFTPLGKREWFQEDILLKEVEEEVVYLDNFKFLKPEVCIIASRHSSKIGLPTLTAHFPGNFNEARLGGKERKLGIAPANYLRVVLQKLIYYGKNLEGYDITLEATHHGPTELSFPILFVEVGSTDKQWSNEKACQAIAETIYDVLNKKLPSVNKVAIGFGGGHYCRKFSQEKIINEFALGHICPKYNLSYITSEMIEEMTLKTKPIPTYALIEKKGLGKEKQRILNLLKKTELKLEII